MHEYIIDTVHFSNKGYGRMAEIWYDAFKENGVEL
jgi:lysophospholipase L1-like esterase